MDTRRIMLTVAYDGTNYSGWQIQPNNETIEGVLNRELTRLLDEEIKVIGASRTDAGVHAEGAICVFDTTSRIPAEKFSYALNRSLPEDIVIRKSQAVAKDFHPRKTETRKTYRYSIWNDGFPMPTNSRYTHHIYGKLDIAAMRKAAKYFVGEHDFAGFCSAGNQTESTVRTIYEMHVREKMHSEMESRICDVTGPEVGQQKRIDIYVTGNGFLYNMVRIIAGTLIEVGQGKIAVSDISDIISSCDRDRAGNTAPAKGLCLMKYLFTEYPDIVT